jgi:hypothetical protein
VFPGPGIRSIRCGGAPHVFRLYRHGLDRYRAAGKKLYLRADAAFASPDVYEYLEESRVLYAMRIKANSQLYEHVDHLMTRPVGRPSAKPKVFYHDFSYWAGS